ncbi:MAG: homoserine dehydrogenase [Lachnospiraceae bacterium]|jgi:homoserine dehydrogenase|nr:homoserine dehydrogenase [Lachnospiraceae bacterium]
MRESRIIRVAILGFGTVGRGVYDLMQRRENELEEKTGLRAQVARILVRDAGRSRDGVDQALITDRFEEILADDSIDIVVEVMGGIEPARTYITEALKSGKSVVTANKDLMAVHGGELLSLAGSMERDLLFEASVAGGIPIIRPMKQCLAGNHITEIIGIVNGTTNYILTRMTQDGMEFSDALAQATELGYAEADPTADVEGYDAGRKLAILASIAFHSRVTFDDVHTEGITKISAADIRYVKEMGCVIKLLAIARETGDGIEASVQPMLLPAAHPLASVNDVFNAVFVHGDAIDDAMFYGRGAGRYPTASACMGDIIDCMRNIHFRCMGRIGCSCYRSLPVKSMEETMQRYFLRLQVEDKPGVLACIASVMGRHGVSVKQMVQKPIQNNSAELVLISDSVREADFCDALEEFRGMDMIYEVSSLIRVYE